MDNIDRAMNKMKKVADDAGVVAFRIEIGDQYTNQKYVRKENWAQYARRVNTEVQPAKKSRKGGRK